MEAFSVELIKDPAMDLRLLEESWKAVKPHADVIVGFFFDQLGHPTSASRLRAQVNFVSHLIEYWNEPDHLMDYLKKAGVKLGERGVTLSVLENAKRVTLDTLETFLEQYWTPQLKDAWVHLLDFTLEYLRMGLEVTPEGHSRWRRFP